MEESILQLSGSTELDVFLNELKSEQKATRRKGLKDLQKWIESNREMDSSLSVIPCHLISLISKDEVDSLRESSSCSLLKLVSDLKMDAQLFGMVVKLLLDRGREEKSEEVRLTLVKILHKAIKVQTDQGEYLKNLDDLTKILKLLVTDNFPEIIKESCEIILTLSDLNSHFGLQADYMVEPLMQNLKNQPFKVRVACVKALHPVLSKAPLTIPNVVPQLERSWSENGPQFKLAVVQSVGRTALEVESDDQSYYLLLPVLLLGTCNDFSEVSEEAQSIWNRLKNQLDEPKRFLKHSFSKLLPDILKNAENWSNDIRCQTAQLLLRFLEETSGRRRELPTLMEILVHQAGDDESTVRLCSLKSAYLLGQSRTEEVLKWFETRPMESSADISIFHKVLLGALSSNSMKGDLFALCIDLLVKCASLKELGSSDGMLLLKSLELFLERDDTIDSDRMDQLLLVVILLEEETHQDGDNHSIKLRLLERIAKKLGYTESRSMFQQRLPQWWASRGFEEPNKWTGASSHAWRVLHFIALDLKLIDGYVFKLLIETISSTQIPEIKLKSLNILTVSMDYIDPIECDSSALRSLLQMELKWRAGRSAAVLRSSATLCACMALHHGRLVMDASNVEFYVDSFLPLVEDEVIQTRLSAVRVLQRCLLLVPQIPKAKIDIIFSNLMGRLNDISKDVRHEVMSGLRDVILSWRKARPGLPEGYQGYEKKFTDLVRVLSRDDDDPPSQTFARDILQSMTDSCDDATDLAKKLNVSTLECTSHTT